METENKQLSVIVFSFGFKYGVPDDVTTLFDVRFLPNPYWEEGMRHLTGLDLAVDSYVLESEVGSEFYSELTRMVDFLITCNIEAGKDEIRLGIGCTGGHHRSVATVERLTNYLSKNSSIALNSFHRDIERVSESSYKIGV